MRYGTGSGSDLLLLVRVPHAAKQVATAPCTVPARHPKINAVARGKKRRALWVVARGSGKMLV